MIPLSASDARRASDKPGTSSAKPCELANAVRRRTGPVHTSADATQPAASTLSIILLLAISLIERRQPIANADKFQIEEAVGNGGHFLF